MGNSYSSADLRRQRSRRRAASPLARASGGDRNHRRLGFGAARPQTLCAQNARVRPRQCSGADP